MYVEYEIFSMLQALVSEHWSWATGRLVVSLGIYQVFMWQASYIPLEQHVMGVCNQLITWVVHLLVKRRGGRPRGRHLFVSLDVFWQNFT